MAIQVGAEAPDFELPSSDEEGGRPGKKIKLSALRGKPVVLAFYPLAFSPVCTGEMSCMREDLAKFNGLGAHVLGVSVDSAWTLAAFKKSLSLEFPLLADFHPKGAMATQYGLYLADKGITARATVIVDKDGKVAFVKEQAIPEARSDEEILAAIRALG
jgi:peroxiredoxin